MMELENIRFDGQGLVPAIAQDVRTGKVLVLAYMNEESLRATQQSGYATYWSRSRRELWRKGETSGHVQKVCSITYDCDGDALLLRVEQTGPACHTGEESCFHKSLLVCEGQPDIGTGSDSRILEEVYAVIQERKANPKEGSYTNYLLAKGTEKICKKVGEEATETVIAAIKGDVGEICYEAADLCYHLLVLLAERDIPIQSLWAELESRR